MHLLPGWIRSELRDREIASIVAGIKARFKPLLRNAATRAERKQLRQRMDAEIEADTRALREADKLDSETAV